MRKHNKTLTPNAKALRKNMTRQERKLWYEFLRIHPLRFLRQKVITNFIVDFYCNKAKLVIEIDGSQHYSEQGQAHDNERTAIIESFDLKVIRFSNLDIDRNFEGVCQMIDDEVRKRVDE